MNLRSDTEQQFLRNKMCLSHFQDVPCIGEIFCVCRWRWRCNPVHPLSESCTQREGKQTLKAPKSLNTAFTWRRALYNKVNRCLARYSPRATTTNRPTNRAPKKPAWPGPNWPKIPILGQIWSFLGKKSFFYWRNQKFCYPHNGKPT